jgi:hypothetical protein
MAVSEMRWRDADQRLTHALRLSRGAARGRAVARVTGREREERRPRRERVTARERDDLLTTAYRTHTRRR